MLIEAHRGDSANAPENTIASFRQAIKAGAHWLELDVRQAADGSIVVIHDDSVERTTNGSGKVSEMSLSQLKRLDAGSWFGARFQGERIPTLSEILELVTGRNISISIEIKGSLVSSPIYGPLAEMLIRHNPSLPHVVISAKVTDLLQLRNLAPEQELGLISRDPESIGVAIECRLSWFHGHHSIMTSNHVRRMRDIGIKSCAWTVNTIEDYLKMRLAGVEMVCTDNPGKYVLL